MYVGECERLDDYLLGGLSEDESARFEDHLSGCAACREEIREQRRMDRLLAEGAAGLEPVPTGLIGRIEQAYGRVHRCRVIGWAWGLSAAAVAASVLAAWLAWGAAGRQEGSPPVVRESPQRAGDPEEVKPAGPEAPGGLSAAEVRLSDPSEAILLPMETARSDISIVWVYPTLRPARQPGILQHD